VFVAGDTSRFDLDRDGTFETGPIPVPNWVFTQNFGFGDASKYFVYLSDRMKIAPRALLILGLRYDHFIYSAIDTFWSDRYLTVVERYSYGLELLVEQKRVEDYFGTLSVSLSRSREKDPRKPQRVDFYVYIALMNVLNTKNVFFENYRSDRTKETVYQFSFFPVGGVEVEF